MIMKHSKFYFGFVIDADNRYLDFKEGSGPEVTAEIAVGSYSSTQLCAAVKQAMSEAGAFAYSVTFNRTNRKITITSTGGSHTLLTGNGTHIGSDPFELMGFTTGMNSTSATSHVGENGAGFEYIPQFPLQAYVASKDLQGAADASINKTASGRVEVVKFGTEKFMECSIVLASNRAAKIASFDKPSMTGADDLRSFLQYLVSKAPVEFMENEDEPQTFETMILESTPEDSKGTKYRMREQYDKGFQNFFETGRLVFRVIED